jgi:hypothetical protein
MRVSPDKVNKLAEINEVEFQEDRDTIRKEVRNYLQTLLADEMRIDQAARAKISSQRKIIMEGTQEWNILYRKYYNDEVKRLGI